MAKEIGVSPIPVRDAINKLRHEGLIETRGDGGTFVPEPSYEELMDIYDQREALECHAVSRVAEYSNAADLADLEGCVEELTAVCEILDNSDPKDRDPAVLERWACADAAFHDTIMRVAGNLRSLQTIYSLRVKTQIFGKQVRYEPYGSLQRTQKEHKRILDAIRQGNVEEARLAMAEHIRSGCRLILRSHHRDRMRFGSDG